ncbi:cellulose biosynthesis cyclic di-GMP-binding regulatory protein BcsB [Tistrella bauzanensis]
MANLPDLAVTAGTGFPYDRPGRQLAPFDVVVAMDRPAEVTAAMLVVARMARAAGQPLQASFHDSMPRLQGRDTLIVAPTARLGLDLIAAAPVGPDQIARLNRGRLPEAAPDDEPETAGEDAGAAAAGPQLLAAPPGATRPMPAPTAGPMTCANNGAADWAPRARPDRMKAAR